MNSLIKSSDVVKKIAIALTIVCSFALSIAAQNVNVPQSQGRMYGEPGFKGEPINLNVVNADIRDILSYITDQYGINFVIDKSVKEVPVTVKVNDVPWNVALDSVLQSQELGVQVNGTILRIADNKTLASEGELYRERLNNQLDTSSLFTELIRLNYATATGGAQQGSTTSGTTVGYESSSSSSSSGGSQASGGSGGSGLLPIIKRRLSRRGSIEVDTRSNALIVTDVPSNITAIKQLIAILDQPEPQVEIEARIVAATRNFTRDIGFQWNALVLGNNLGGAQGGTLPSVLNGGRNQGNGTILPGTGVGSNDLASSIPNTILGLTTGIFGTAKINALITLGEQRGQAKIIATPRVTALNNRPAEIKSGSQIPVTTIQPGSAAGGAVIATTEYIDVPLRLAVTPQITDEGTVILTIVAENSSASVTVGGIAPAINTQSMTTQVIVPDGGTTVVGGVLFDDERDSQDRTPGIASVPLLGNLFKRKGVQRNTNEILFFITPRISHPDYAAPRQTNAAPLTPAIPQPVPMGNPPSNSQPMTEPAPMTPMLFQSPGMGKPETPVVTTPGKRG